MTVPREVSMLSKTARSLSPPILAAILVVGCAGGPGDGTADGGPEELGGGGFSEQDVIDAVAAFQDTGFAQMNQDPFSSQHGNAELVNVWVSDDEADAYAAIDPADSDATAGPFPVGTIVVKEHLDEDGASDGASTVMAKMDDGFNEDAGDWWWGRFDTDGNLAESGDVGYCISCHEGSGFARTDWVGGVEQDNLR